MNKKSTKKNISIVISLLLILTFVSCTKTDKETVLSPNVSEDIKAEENEVKLTLEKGHNFLKDGDFESAKSTYEKAISMDKTNKDIYLEIKDKYVAIDRFNDAISIIQIAINNSTDIENMKVILDEIISNFQTDLFIKDLYEGDNFTLPSELTAKINNEYISIPVTWNNPIVDTSTSGTFYFVGTNKEHNREFNATINVLPPVIVEEPVAVLDEEHALVKSIYKSDGKTYVDVDLVEVLTGDVALKAAISDDSIYLATIDGVKFLPNNYYIRDQVHSIVTYEVSENSTFTLSEYVAAISNDGNSFDSDSIKSMLVSYNELESHFKYFTPSFENHLTSNISPLPLFFLIKLKNDVVYDMGHVYTP